LVTVTVFAALVLPNAWLPNPRFAGKAATGITPVPESATVCGLLLASSVIVSEPVRAPSEVGVKVKFRVQLLLAARDELQVVPATAKSPDAIVLRIFKAIVWLFVILTVLFALAPPTAWLPNDTLKGETV